MDTSPRSQYRELIAQVAEKAKKILPQEVNGRIESACKLVLNGDVEPLEDGSIKVGSSDPARWYHLIGIACTCTDFVQQKAPSGWCKHRIAAGISKRVHEMLAALPAPPRASQYDVATLPEAPASVNVRVLVQGHEVQWTLRDADESRLAERLTTLLKRYPAPAPSRPSGKPAGRQGARQGGSHG